MWLVAVSCFEEYFNAVNYVCTKLMRTSSVIMLLPVVHPNLDEAFKSRLLIPQSMSAFYNKRNIWFVLVLPQRKEDFLLASSFQHTIKETKNNGRLDIFVVLTNVGPDELFASVPLRSCNKRPVRFVRLIPGSAHFSSKLSLLTNEHREVMLPYTGRVQCARRAAAHERLSLVWRFTALDANNWQRDALRWSCAPTLRQT